MSGSPLRVVVSCEHATARVPAAYAQELRVPKSVLASHRGWDPGAIELARELARDLAAPLFAARATRLLVDANRSLDNRACFSKWSERLPEQLRERAVREHWSRHRDAVRDAVQARLGEGPVLHLSVHSFTPRFRGVERAIDVAALYDPSRAGERTFATAWLAALHAERPGLRLRRNAPYRGIADGLTTTLRKSFGPDYSGIELEISQRLVRSADYGRLRAAIRRAVAVTIGQRPETAAR